MGKQKASFNDIVTQVKSAPKPELPIRPEPGKTLIAPDGTVFHNTDEILTLEETEQLLTAKAWIAIDTCGCGGYCTPQWRSLSDTNLQMPQIRKAKKNQEPFASIEKWQTDTGATMIFFSGPDFIWQ